MKNNPEKRKIRKTVLEKRIKYLERKLIELKAKKKIELSKEGKLSRKFPGKDSQMEAAKLELLEIQNELQKSLGRYVDLYDYTPMGYMTLDDEGVIKGINLTGASMLGKGKRYINNIPFISFLGTAEVNKFTNLLNSCRLHNTQIVDDFKLNLKGNETLYLKLFIFPLPDYSIKKTSYRVVMYDDSQRKRAEKALKESEIRFSNLADNVPVLIWMFNKEQKLEYINKQRFHFTGLSAEEEGSSWFENVHPQDREFYGQKYNDAFSLHKKFSIEYRLKDYKNDYHWLLETTIPRFSEEKEFLGLIGTSIDITERKKARISMENSLKEKEILVKEIHHRVKNNLQIVSSLLNLQTFYIKDPKILDLIKGSQERIRSMALVHEKLYRSKDLLKINFEEYAKDLTSHLFQSYRKNINIRLNLNVPKILLEINVAISLGLILNELVSNSLKYAFSGRKEGEIAVTLLHHKKNNLELIVSDDGIGFPKDFNISNSEGMGLELVESLVQQHSGKLNIIHDGKTEFQISMEMGKEKPRFREIGPD
jgi:PAS domain S-box-containing protein